MKIAKPFERLDLFGKSGSQCQRQQVPVDHRVARGEAPDSVNLNQKLFKRVLLRVESVFRKCPNIGWGSNLSNLPRK